MLELKDATIRVGERSLLGGRSLTVDDGEALYLTGGEGTGKTLLLKALMGLWPLAHGFVSIDGELLTPSSAPEFRRHTAYVPQAPAPMGLSVEALACLPYTFEAHKGKPFSKDRLMEEWQALGLAPALYTKADGQLTASERQRVMLATAGALDKPIVLVDEPFADGFHEGVAAYLVRLAAKGASVLVATRRDVGGAFATMQLS